MVFYEKPFPEFTEGDYVRFVTQGNILVSYEILEKAEVSEEQPKVEEREETAEESIEQAVEVEIKESVKKEEQENKENE